jgi:hypothetical protein
MDQVQYVKLKDIYDSAKVDWDAIHYRNGSSESEDLEHWTAMYGKILLQSIDEILRESLDIIVADGRIDSRNISRAIIPFTAE